MCKTKTHLATWITLTAMVLSLINPFAVFAYLSDDVTETASPIDNGKTEIFTDDCMNLDSVYGGTLKHFQQNTADDSYRAWNDTSRIRPKTVGADSEVPDDRHLIYAAPDGKDIVSFAFWMYFYGSGRMDMDIYVSSDGISYENVQCEQFDPARYEYESGKYSFYHRVFSLDNLDAGIKYVKLAWKNWGKSQATEGHLGKVQLGYVNEHEPPIEIYGELSNDILRNTEKLFSFSGVEPDYSEHEKFNYDSARLTKTQEKAYAVYKSMDGYNITDFAAWTYYENSKSEAFKFYASSDGEDYTVFTPEIEEDSSNGCLEAVYYAENIPVGSKYLKIEFPSDENAQLGQVMFGNSRYKFKVTENTVEGKTASVKVSNRSIEDEEVSLVLVQYSADNEMLYADIDTEILLSGETKILTADISDTQSEGEIKAFLCSGLNDITPSEGDAFSPEGTITLNEAEVNGYSITLSGVLTSEESDRKVNVIVLKAETDASSILLSDIVYIGQTDDINDDGSFELTFNMPESSQSEYYTVSVSGTDADKTQTTQILFINANDSEEVTALVNAASTADEVKAIFDGTSEDGDFTLSLTGMNMNMEIYADMREVEKSSVAQMVLEEGKNAAYTSEHLLEFFNKAVVTVMVNSAKSDADIEKVFAEGNEIFGFDDENSKFGAAYKAMKDEEKDAFYVYMLSAIPLSSPEELKDTVNDAVIVAYFNTASYDEIEDLLAEYKDDIGIDDDLWNDYKSMSRYNKSLVDKAMTGNDFESTDEIKKAFEDAADDVNNDDSGSSGGSGSKRGSSGGTSKASVLYGFENTSESEKEKISFTDLDGFEWALESIEYLTEKEIISGYGYGTFKPSQNVKREEFIKMLTVAFEVAGDNGKCNFTDLSETDWSYKYIASAYNLGIVNGYTDGRFGKGENITREDMAVMAYNILLKQGIELESSDELFADNNDISSYALEAVKRLCASGVINGVGDNRFAPSELTTRAQAAKVIYGLLQLR